jgi:NADH-quinone oxidoreductase subunit F
METNMLAELVERIRHGNGEAALYNQFQKILDFSRGKGFCTLIHMPGPPLMSALRLFKEDFDYHLQHGVCGQSRQPS